MRDIRPDLQERVNEIDAEIDHLDSRAKLLIELRGYYARMLEAEEHRWGRLAASATNSTNGHVAVPTPKVAGREQTPLAKFIIESLSDHQARSEKEVAEIAVARGFPFGAKNPLKVIHFAMIGMGQGKQLEKIAKSVWRLPASTAIAQKDSDRTADPA